MRIIKTLRFQLIVSLLAQFAFLAIVMGTTLYEISLRKHDYVILNLSGQLRVISQQLVEKSQNLLSIDNGKPLHIKSVSVYEKEINSLTKEYDQIIESFKQRELSSELTGRHDPLYCSWDKQSKNQLDITANTWDNYFNKLNTIGSDKPGGKQGSERAKLTANHIVTTRGNLLNTSTDLTMAFQKMMEGKLKNISLLQQFALIASVFIAFGILLLLYKKALKPLQLTIAGLSAVTRGDLQHKINTKSENELGVMAGAFNKLTARMDTLFRLSEKINNSNNLDETLRFIYTEFRSILKMDLIVMLSPSPDKENIIVERLYTDTSKKKFSLKEKTSFSFNKSTLIYKAVHTKIPVIKNSIQSMQEKDIDSLREPLKEEKSREQKDEIMLQFLRLEGFHSMLLLPMALQNQEPLVLLFATKDEAGYNDEHLELMKNFGSLFSNSVNKTLGLESLVISAVSGLAKLAESRDPETGDHLFRMSMYSAIIAESIGQTDKYRNIITVDYIRNLFQFAPMHDIGKVGIPDQILLKPGRLDAIERKVMEEHPEIGAEVLRRCEKQMQLVGFTIFQTGIDIASGHHEKFDGSGYPKGLSGEDIPLSARIVAAADVFDALTSKRPYKEAWSVEKAIDLMKSESGKHFDPITVEHLLLSMPRILEIYNAHKHI